MLSSCHTIVRVTEQADVDGSLCDAEYRSGRRSPPPFGGSMLSTSSAGSPLGSRNTSGLSAAAASLESGQLSIRSADTAG